MRASRSRRRPSDRTTGLHVAAIDLFGPPPNNVEMSKMNFHPESLFDTNQGENAVWSQLQAALAERDGDTFYRLPIIDSEGRFMFEPDIVVAPRGTMPLVIECKGCRLSDIKSIQGAVWLMADTWNRAQENPFSQARSQAIALGKMLAGAGNSAPIVHSLVALPFIAREDWEPRFGALGCTPGILFADDIQSPGRLASRILGTARNSRLDPDQWNRFAEVLGARDRWAGDTPAASPVAAMRAPFAVRAAAVATVPEGQDEQPITILRYGGRPPTAAEVANTVGIDLDPDPSEPQTPYTYLVATAALERQRSHEGLGGQHQLKKQLRPQVTPPEEMQLLFHKALRHFIAREVLSRAEERVLIQRAIHELAQGDRAVFDQLRRDVFAWRDVLAEIEEEGIDLAAVGDAGAQWAHPELKSIAGQLQSTYRKMRRGSGRARQTFEESARQYLATQYVPTPIVVMEGFTRLTPLQQEFIERCAGVPGLRLWIILPDNADQQPGFAALDRTYQPFLARVRLAKLPTPVLGAQKSLAHLQRGLFSLAGTPCSHADDGVTLKAFAHRNDEVAYCVGKVIELVYPNGPLAARDIAVVCSDVQAMAPLLREEAELRGHADLFAVPPRQLLLTPVGRFILVLYEVWKDAALEIDSEQLAALFASGWLGAHVQKRAELFTAVSHQHFTFCRSKAEWLAALDRLRQQMGEGDTVLGQLASRLPSTLVASDDLVHWGPALEVGGGLCKRIFVAGERTIGDHIAMLLDQMQQLVPHHMLQTERQVLEDIRAAFKDIVDSRSVAIDASEFGEVLGSLIREREGEEDGDLPGSDPGPRTNQVWVIGPEGIDNVERHTVFFLGLDESRMPAPGSPPWPRINWSAQEHTERQRYRFLAVIRAARQRLLLSYACQDWERHYQPSPYFDETLYLLGRSLDADAPASPPSPAQTTPVVSVIDMTRDRYTLSELASYRLCPYRFKMEALTDAAGVYTTAWQLEWLARGIWLAEALYLIATRAPGRHAADKFRRVMARAIEATRAPAMARLPGLRPLAWTGIERHVRDTVDNMLKPVGDHVRPLLGIEIPHPRERTKPLVIGGVRHVQVVGEADFMEYRDPFLNAIKGTNQSALWLIAGRGDQPISEDAEDDEAVFKTLAEAVAWWRNMRFWVTMHSPKNPSFLRADIAMELSDCIQKVERGKFPKNPGDHCKYCPVVDTCMGRKP